MGRQKGSVQNVMASLYKKATSYGAAVTMDASNAVGALAFEFEPEWAPQVVVDKELITGYEEGTDLDIMNYDFKATYKEPRARYNYIAGLAALASGSVTSSQDGALAAYRHKIIRSSMSTDLPDINIEHLKGSLQYVYRGVMCDVFKLSGKARDYVNLEATLIGSGYRATAATSFQNPLSERPLKCAGTKLWLETGANISITDPPTQGSQAISSATPDAYATRVDSFEFTRTNGLIPVGMDDADGYKMAMDFTRRKTEFKCSAAFVDDTELGYFTALDKCAIDLDITTGTIIAATGTYYYGIKLIIPQAQIMNVPDPKGGTNDLLTVDLEFDIQEDGTNPPYMLYVYNANDAYLA